MILTLLCTLLAGVIGGLVGAVAILAWADGLVERTPAEDDVADWPEYEPIDKGAKDDLQKQI